MLEAALSREYWKGVEDGMRRYAWWKDVVEYVGTCGTTLKAAIREMDRESGRPCPHHFREMDMVPQCLRCGILKPCIDGA